MDHSISKIKVYKSNDYKRFRFVDGNRLMNKKKIERIISEIKAGNDVLDESPVLVNETGKFLDIKDGQHRFMVAKQLGRDVHYIIKEKQLSLYNVAKVNSNTERWKDQDYINCYVKAGNDHYKIIDAFHKKYKVAVGVCLALLTYGTHNSSGSAVESIRAKFQQGTFEVKHKKEATQLIEICKQFEDFPGWNNRVFITAISKIVQAGLCDFDVLVRKFKKDPKKLDNHSNWKAYVNNLEMIYNFDNSKRRTII